MEIDSFMKAGTFLTSLHLVANKSFRFRTTT